MSLSIRKGLSSSPCVRVFPSGFQAPFLSSLPHSSEAGGRKGKKRGQILGVFEEHAFTKLWFFSLPGTLIT